MLFFVFIKKAQPSSAYGDTYVLRLSHNNLWGSTLMASGYGAASEMESFRSLLVSFKNPGSAFLSATLLSPLVIQLIRVRRVYSKRWPPWDLVRPGLPAYMSSWG